jgi:hypothetical protein
MEGERGACMTRWSSEFRLLAAAIVALSCSGRDANAFALCATCPDLFAGTSTAQRTARTEPTAESARAHDRYVSRRPHQSHDDSSSPARRTALAAFAAVRLRGKSTDPSVRLTIADPPPPVADQATPATPTLRIDQLFNILAAGPSDQPDEAAALRASVLNQLLMRQSAPSPGEGVGFLIRTLVVLGGGLLIGAVLISSRRHVSALPRILGGQPGRTKLPSDQVCRLTRRMSSYALEGPTELPWVRERLTGLLDQTGTTPAGGWPRWGMSDPERGRGLVQDRRRGSGPRLAKPSIPDLPLSLPAGDRLRFLGCPGGPQGYRTTSES